MTTPNKSTAKLDALLADTIEHHAEVTPPQDLWRGIEASISRQQVQAQLQPQSKLNWTWLTGLAASVFVAVGVFMSSMQAPTPAPGGQQLGHSQLLSMVTEQHDKQRNMLLTNYQAAGLQPTFSELESELQQLRDAANQVTQQLQNEPNNAELWQFLQWLHQQELDLLKTMYLQPRSYQQL